MNKKQSGIAALIGLGVSALAVLGYKRLPKEQKDKIKDTLSSTGDKITETASGVKESLSDKYDRLASKTKHTSKSTKKDVEEKLEAATA